MSKALAFCTIGMVVMMVGSASAGELTAVQGGSVDVGTYRGVVYYTEEGNDFRVVTTIASTPDGSEPVRFVATLAENEHLLISVPGKAGETAQVFDIERFNGMLLLRKGETAAAAAVSANE